MYRDQRTPPSPPQVRTRFANNSRQSPEKLSHPARQPVWALENEARSDAIHRDLQNKATVAGDEPQVSAAPHVQEPENVRNDHRDSSPQEYATAAVPELDDATKTTAEEAAGVLQNGLAERNEHLACQPERVEHEDSGQAKQVRTVNQHPPTAQSIRPRNTEHAKRPETIVG